MKKCNTCGIEKNLDDFSEEKRNRDGRLGSCKACRSASARERRKDVKYRDVDNARRMVWYRNNYHARRYGISESQYDELLQKQGGRCAVCKTTKHGRGSRYKWWNVDHRHGDNVVRGLLCHQCNIGIGRFEILCESVGRAKVLAYIDRGGLA